MSAGSDRLLAFIRSGKRGVWILPAVPAFVLAARLLIVSFRVNPAIDAADSGARFIRNVERHAANSAELGLVAYREQHLLRLRRFVVNFWTRTLAGVRQEAADAVAWLAAKRTACRWSTNGLASCPDGDSADVGQAID
jgi:hypothetical protein